MPWFKVREVIGATEAGDGEKGLPVALAFNVAGERWLRRYRGKDVQIEIVGHSDSQHRTFFGYLHFVHAARYREEYPEFDDFREWLSVCVGHTRRKTIMVPVAGGREAFVVLRVLSWSQGECADHDFKALVKRAQEFLERETGITVGDYIANMRDADEEAALTQ